MHYLIKLEMTMIHKNYRRQYHQHKEYQLFLHLTVPRILTQNDIKYLFQSSSKYEHFKHNNKHSHCNSVLSLIITIWFSQNYSIWLTCFDYVWHGPVGICTKRWVIKRPIRYIHILVVYIPHTNWQVVCNLHPGSVTFIIAILRFIIFSWSWR
jgi:hypothetical protein